MKSDRNASIVAVSQYLGSSCKVPQIEIEQLAYRTSDASSKFQGCVLHMLSYRASVDHRLLTDAPVLRAAGSHQMLCSEGLN